MRSPPDSHTPVLAKLEEVGRGGGQDEGGEACRALLSAYLGEEDEEVRLGAARDAVREAGFASLGCFVLAESEWWDDYYTPIEARLDSLARERDDKAWADALATHREELEIVRLAKGSFGYAFFVMQKVD